MKAAAQEEATRPEASDGVTEPDTRHGGAEPPATRPAQHDRPAETQARDAIGAAQVQEPRPAQAGEPARPVIPAETRGAPQTPPLPAQQIAAALHDLGPDRPVEISLRPQELGHVRMVLHHGDAGLSVTIAVERPETMEMMRRHIDVLASHLREIGYADFQMNLGASGHGDARGGRQPPPSEPALGHAVPEMPEPGTSLARGRRPAGVGTGRIDLRI